MVLAGGPGQALAGVSIPDWVHQAAAQPLGGYPPETDAVVLLDQTDYTITDPGEYIEHARWVVRVLRPEGRDEGELVVDLGQHEKLNYIHAWTIDRAAHEYELKPKDFVEKSFTSFALYDDIKFMAATAPAADPGSTIAFEYEVRRHSWINQLNLLLQEPNPVLLVKISLSLPKGWELKDSWPQVLGLTSAQDASGRWQWTGHDMPGIQREPMMPHRSSLLGRMAIAYFPPGEVGNFGTWQSLGTWYSGLTAGRRDASPEIVQEAITITAGKSEFRSKLQALTRFIQSQIRYVAIEIGIGGFQPHSASEVFRYRYGDCKDKATLLSSMLKTVGIDSSYLIIHTQRGAVDPAVPSVHFNHVILAIELPGNGTGDYQSVITARSGKRYLLFDPTDEYTPVGSLRADLQDSYALLVTDSGGELIQTPLLPPDWNMVKRTGHFVLTTGGGLSGEVIEDRNGDSATNERARLRESDQRERTRAFEHWLGRSVPGFSLESIDFQQTDQLEKDLVINYKFTTPQYGQQRGPLMLLRARVLDEKGATVEHKPRHYALELGRTTRQTDAYEIEIPEGYLIDDIPDPVRIDVGFASYHSKTEVDGSKLKYSREYVIRNVSVPPEKFSDWAKLQGVIGADESAAVILKRAP
jgi:hypothetical protein